MPKRMIKALFSRAFNNDELITGTNITYNGVNKHTLDTNIIDRPGIPEVKPFFNPTYGFDLNQNGSSGGTPEAVHNGTDSTLWTASAISGTWNFASTSKARSGTKSIDATLTTKDREALLKKSTTIDISNYVSLTGWIYITSWAENGDNDINLRTRVNGTNVGNSVNLSSYINKGTFNVWQKFSISKADLGLSTQTIDEIVVKTLAEPSANPPDYYLDDIQFEQTGGSIIFEINPSANTIYNVFNFIFFGVATLDTRTTNPINANNISYNKFFGQTKLTSGLISTTTLNNVITFAGVFLQNADFLLIPRTDFSSGGDGTTTWYRYQTIFDKPVRLDSTTNDNMRFIVSDDLSGMPFFRIFTNGFSETL